MGQGFPFGRGSDLASVLVIVAGEALIWFWHMAGGVPLWVTVTGHATAVAGLASYGARVLPQVVCVALEGVADIVRSYRSLRREVRKTFRQRTRKLRP